MLFKEFDIRRHEKRWYILRRLYHVTVPERTYSVTVPGRSVQVEVAGHQKTAYVPGYQLLHTEPSFLQPTPDGTYITEFTTTSFTDAKVRYNELLETYPISDLLLLRTVDMWTVLQPDD